jgi:hypothetical protein
LASSPGSGCRIVKLTALGFAVSCAIANPGRGRPSLGRLREVSAVHSCCGFTALAESVGPETILGAFAAGALLSLLDRDEAATHPQFRLKLEAVGFALVYVRVLGRPRSLIAGLLQARSLPFIVAATQIGLQLGTVSRARAADAGPAA